MEVKVDRYVRPMAAGNLYNRCSFTDCLLWSTQSVRLVADCWCAHIETQRGIVKKWSQGDIHENLDLRARHDRKVTCTVMDHGYGFFEVNYTCISFAVFAMLKT
jgi:hypothetical protein